MTVKLTKTTVMAMLLKRVKALETELAIAQATIRTLREHRDLAINGLLAWNGLPPLPAVETEDHAQTDSPETGSYPRLATATRLE